jgi:hypothetical protein
MRQLCLPQSRIFMKKFQTGMSLMQMLVLIGVLGAIVAVAATYLR